MEKLVNFEEMLFGSDPVFEPVKIINPVFWAEKLTRLPTLRPFLLDEVVTLCHEYSSLNHDFSKCLLDFSVKICPVLLFRLFNKGVFSLSQIMDYFDDEQCPILKYYYHEFINDFSVNDIDSDLIDDFDQIPVNIKDIDQCIQYGFLPSSAEYCLKYDDISNLMRTISQSEEKEQNAKWNPFEWASKPSSMYYLAFSGYFGSLKCFKQLLMTVYYINDQVRNQAICNGSISIFHFCNIQNPYPNELIHYAAKFCHVNMIKYLVENGANINFIDSSRFFRFSLIQLFIMLR